MPNWSEPQMQRIRPAILLVLVFALRANAQSDAPQSWTASPATKDDDGFLVHTVEASSQRDVTKVRVLLPPEMEAKSDIPSFTSCRWKRATKADMATGYWK
jgi:hypothetical protein